MSEVAPGWKLRVLLAQALFSNPDILLLDEPTNNLDINTIRWLEQVLNDRESTMIIISHDRHFLNSVCTHMADLDGELRVYPGNYDEYMLAATQARERLLADNAKKKAQIADLQSFVSRFSANASKSSQATSRLKPDQRDQSEEVKVSSRQNPFIRFEQDKKLYRNILEIEGVSKGYGDGPLFKGLDMMLEVGEKVAILGTNGIGKSTLIKTLVGALAPDTGTIKWSRTPRSATTPRITPKISTPISMCSTGWPNGSRRTKTSRRCAPWSGRLLFLPGRHREVKVLSGGEQGRMLFGKLMMQRPNILIMDEPTNHLDMESIESLNLALEMYKGTLIFVSHDREFVSSLATRILELTEDGIRDFGGTYEDYLRSKGIE
ncbi:ATP-binding cassette domain-containing protein [Escherichia coli]